MTDYTTLITSEHQKPNFTAVVDVVANGIGAITSVIQSIPGLYDLDNAVGDQQDTVGEWVGQSRNVPGVLTVGFFGFSDDVVAATFGELNNASIGGRFYELNESFSSTGVLSDTEYREVLRTKIVRNQWDGSISGLESSLDFLFPGVAIAIHDPSNGTVTVNIPSASVTLTQRALLSGFDLLPRAAGVKYNISYV